MRGFSSISWDAVRLAPIRFSSRAVTIGFPGAGNVLANAICNRLMEQAAIPDSFGIGDRGSEEERFAKNAILAAFASRYNAMLSLLRSAAPEGTRSFFQNSNLGTCDFMVPFSSGDFLIVRNIDLGVYLNARVHTTHELPLPGTWEFYRSKGFKTILTIRHPLAIIASFASKRPDNELACSEAGAMGVSGANLERATRLGCPNWLSRTALLLNDYYRVVADMVAALPVARLEDGLLKPLQYVNWLAEQLSISVSDKSSEDISRIIGTTPLAPNHFNNPSVDGWRSYFTAKDLEIVEKTGLFATFERFGYSRPNAADLLPLSDGEQKIRAALAGGQSRLNRVSNFIRDFRFLIGTFDSGDLMNALGAADSFFTCRVGEFQIVASDKQIMSEYAARLAEKAVHHLIGPAPPIWKQKAFFLPRLRWSKQQFRRVNRTWRT